MPEARFNFPRGFLWGTATSAYQYEGNNQNNQWFLWEQDPGKIAEGHTCGLAADWWGGRWRDDFDRAQEANHNAMRISFEWSRIQPQPDRWDEDVIDRYIDMLRGLNQRGLFPMVNFHHFTDPLWVTEMGGWENEEVPSLYADYVNKVAEAVHTSVTTWLTINEPNVPALLGYLLGEYPPGKKDLNAAQKVLVNFARAHAYAFHRIKEIQPEARVGFAHAYRGFSPRNKTNPLDRLAAKLHHQVWNDFYPRLLTDGKARLLNKTVEIPEAKNTQDFFGLNYYTSEDVWFDLSAGSDDIYSSRGFPSDAVLSPNGMLASTPGKFFEAIKWSLQFGVPVIITENGTEDEEDSFRREYMASHIHQLWHAVNFNYPIKGYFAWSLVDNFEWNEGWTRRFGMWELDTESQERTRRPSADLYASICRENGLTSEMVRQYAPGLFSQIFPV
jgi:beta-glucosidase